MIARIPLILLLSLICLGAGIWPAGTEAADLSNAFFEADACARALRKSPAAMKSRHNWERCIDRFQEVHRKDPKGPWAPASLYQSASLKLGLHAYSKNADDLRAAVEQFEQVQNKFPDSAYRDRAGAELKRIAKAGGAGEEKAATAEPKVAAKPPAEPARRRPAAAGTPAPAAASAEKPSRQYIQAEACSKKLAGVLPTERTRRDWMLCIGRFHRVYLDEPEGSWAAAGLFMEGALYHDLYKGLKFNSDLRAARENFEKVVKEFPQSPYAAKAAAGIKSMPRSEAEKAAAVKKTVAPAAPPAGRPLPPEDGADAEVQVEAGSEDGRALVSDLQFWSNPNYTRVVVYADRETDYTHRLLKKDPSIDKPPRLYVDMGNSRLSKGIQKSIPINDDLLSDARAGQYTKESVRVVVDIKSFETYKVFTLKDPFRIVIDVWGVNGVAQAGTGSAAEPPAAPGAGPAEKSGKVPRGALAKQLALGVRRIVIDPGHGGKDFGAPGFVPGVHEKDVVLEIAKRVARRIREDLNCEAILTRSDDRYLTLEERTAFANTRSADLFVSIHTNASRDQRAFGIETYFLNLATDEESIRVAAMENATSTKNISDLSSILNDLLKNAKINESSRLAGFVQGSLVRHLNRKGYDRIRDKGVKQAPFYVLLGARMPSILVETSFISNREECRRLTTAAYQEHLAESIVEGLRGYIQEISPTAFSPPPAGDSG
jgi:N-acetylmuramoyl-L-alanine amidase